MSTAEIWLYLAVMAGVTYLIRMLPLAIFQRKLNSRFLKSFLFYVPYAVLTVMTVPAIFESTGCLFSACVGLAVACVLAWRGAQLLPVALAACGAVYATELLLRLLPAA